MSIGMTIIMLMMPMYTPNRVDGIIRTAMMYGTPMIEAQAMPRPMMGMKIRYWFVSDGTIINPTAASSRHTQCTVLAPRFLANATSEKATLKVTMLYQPLTSPVHATASSLPSGVSGKDDFAIERA